MKSIFRITTILVLLAIFWVPTVNAQAKGLLDGKVIFGDDFVLESDQTLEGDLVVFGGDVTIEENATVNGTVVVFGGTITQAGEVRNDIVIFGGQIDLGETAVVQGDVITIGGQIDQAAGAVISGEIVENVPAPYIDIPSQPDIPDGDREPVRPVIQRPEVVFNPFMDVMGVIGNAIVVAALAMLLALFFQPQIEKVGQTITSQPFMSGSIGLLTIALSPFVLLILVITILLIPVAMLSVLLLMLVWLFGTIALGQEIGERFAKSINQNWTPVATIGVGTFLLMFVGGFIGLVPCVGWLVPVVVGFVAIGGVVMTWIGMRSAGKTALVPPAAPIPPA